MEAGVEVATVILTTFENVEQVARWSGVEDAVSCEVSTPFAYIHLVEDEDVQQGAAETDHSYY